MSRAPCVLERGHDAPQLVALDDGVHRDHRRVGERHDGRAGQAGDDLADPIDRRSGGVHHHVLAPARLHDASEHGDQAGDARVLQRGGAPRDEHSLRVEERGDRAQPVDAQRAAAGDEVHDGIGDAQLRGDLHRTGDLDDERLDAARREEVAREARERRGDTAAAEISCASLISPRTGTASTREHVPNPSSSSGTFPSPRSATRSWPVIPRSTSPSRTYSVMSSVRTKRSSIARLRATALSLRSLSSTSIPASRSSDAAGSARRPLFGSATRRRSPFVPVTVALPPARRSRSIIEPIAVAPVLQPLADAADRGARGTGALADVVVAHALVEQPGNVPALPELSQLVDRAQVAQEAQRLVGLAQVRHRAGQLGDLRGDPPILRTRALDVARLCHRFSTLKH